MDLLVLSVMFAISCARRTGPALVRRPSMAGVTAARSLEVRRAHTSHQQQQFREM